MKKRLLMVSFIFLLSLTAFESAYAVHEKESIHRDLKPNYKDTNTALLSTMTYGGMPFNISETPSKFVSTHLQPLENGKYRVTVTNEWKRMPNVRERDLLMFYIQSTGDNYALDNETLEGQQYVLAENLNTGEMKTFTYEYINTPNADSEHFSASSFGVVMYQNLKNDWGEYKVRSIFQRLSGIIEEIPSIHTNSLEVVGGFNHQIYEEDWSFHEAIENAFEPSAEHSKLYDGFLRTETQVIMR
ncbi:hypothetical protein [Pseudalkalibacillus hwajinpoensis]|uniref:Uncharacterized protein n=1 Tax=Guptibacillus hwajinpoensis TaxID=208199 RepID=A0A4U1MMS0_9BACL|nr:hypothetical protein [Pseudalkalibacillus hwajinpoensis]TKD72267.1 hypothetical protein FBF83_05615 [Pseudalkalibacillus hwajinpoensis]